MKYSIFSCMRKEAAHIQKSMERRCLFFVWNSTQTCNKEPLLLHKENTLQQTKSRPNPQPTGILRGEFFSQIFSTTWKYFKEIFALLTLLWRSKLSISYFSKPDLCSLHKREEVERYTGETNLWFASLERLFTQRNKHSPAEEGRR